MKHDLTPAQIRAVEALEEALKRCDKAGLAIYGMQNNLVAYNSKALDDAESKGFVKLNGADPFPCKSLKGVLADSGADCPYCYTSHYFRSQEDDDV
jgi:hypothetical protein